MKTTLSLVFAAALLGLAGTNDGGTARGSAGGDEVTGGLVTLYADDPLAWTFGFRQGRYGHAFQDRMVKNVGSDLAFEGYHPGEFTVGIEGGSTSAIIDLGTGANLKQRYGYEETVRGSLTGSPQGFASIRNDRGRLEILKNYAQQTHQPLAEAAALAEAPNHVPVVDEHIYLIRIKSDEKGVPERFVKLLVVHYEPGESVTIRWQNLD
jgi:hypothetical protein